mmetsp:Transcript_18127/g.43850  ORF Transcript_18127/g.43850 Transcript_18127/m.43850 type:complete len:98 (+) Transcript_18127:2-295(+)
MVAVIFLNEKENREARSKSTPNNSWFIHGQPHYTKTIASSKTKDNLATKAINSLPPNYLISTFPIALISTERQDNLPADHNITQHRPTTALSKRYQD